MKPHQSENSIPVGASDRSGNGAESLAAKHTPGPWQRSGTRVKLGAEDCLAVGPDGYSVALVPIGRTDKDHAGAMADARLIAAAPELLQAAKAVAFSNGFDAALPEKKEALLAAIAKATGA